MATPVGGGGGGPSAASSDSNATTASTSKAGTRPARQQDILAARMKEYEAVHTPPCIDATKPYMARIDGHKFSSYTKGFVKPFDRRIMLAMVSLRDCSAALLLLLPRLHSGSFTHPTIVAGWNNKGLGGRV